MKNTEEILEFKGTKSQKSVAFTPIPINAALRAADSFLGKNLPWFPVNEIQKEYLKKFFEKETEEYDFVKRTASNIKAVIQKFLSDNGFPGFNIPNINPKLEFYIATVMDQIVEWLYEGETTKMKGQDGNIYEAAEFDDKKSVRVLKSGNYPHPVAVLNTKSEDKVYLTFLDAVNDDETQFGFEMTELAQSITDQLKEFPTNVWKIIDSRRWRIFNTVIIPKIDFEGDINMDWIVKMKTIHPWYISWATMKVKLRLNHIGARAQAAVVAIATGCAPSPSRVLKFDRPFMIWFTHQGKVTFVMYMDYDCWKDPGDDIFS